MAIPTVTPHGLCVDPAGDSKTCRGQRGTRPASQIRDLTQPSQEHELTLRLSGVATLKEARFRRWEAPRCEFRAEQTFAWKLELRADLCGAKKSPGMLIHGNQ